jgi:alpha-L-rhamnosidase
MREILDSSETALQAGFAAPPQAFGPVPFWWWVGETLELDRLVWQLDQLRANGVHCAVVSYNHDADGRPELGDPPVFSEAWWHLFNQVLAACEARGMTLGFQDYTLLNPMLIELGRDDPALRGRALRELHGAAGAGEPCALRLPESAALLEAVAFRRCGDAFEFESAHDLRAHVDNGTLRWRPEAGEWLVSLVYTLPTPFDPLHPRSGQAAIAAYYARFEQHCPGALGRTLTISFQDELDFQARFPLWSAHLPEAFAERTGHALAGRLPMLWHELGPETQPFRLAFSDTASQLVEDAWFKPIYAWHTERGLLFGHDNMGRGSPGTGREVYGDYFGAMRWYSAPGSDDPDLRGPRNVRGIKVSASIAHVHGRPRVWAECFHSSGWGVTPADLLRGVNSGLARGATLINLHGLYYTTFGSWWEWAPPDFHFRQPWWRHASALNDYIRRACWLLSQGAPCADVAILYPGTAIVGGLNQGLGSEPAEALSLSESQRGEDHAAVDPAETLAFKLAERLFDAALDADFVDDASLAAAVVHAGRLQVGACRFRTLVLPLSSTVRLATLRAAQALVDAGGTVIAVGCRPCASDWPVAFEDSLATRLDALFGAASEGGAIEKRHANGGRAIVMPVLADDFPLQVQPEAERPLAVSGARLHVLHRRLEGAGLWFVHNPAGTAVRATLRLRCSGAVERWDLKTGARARLATASGGRARVEVVLPAGAAIVVWAEQALAPSSASDPADAFAAARSPLPSTRPVWHERMRLPDTGWSFELIPTLDNRHGDFARPPSPTLIGAEARRLWHREGCAARSGRERPGLDPGAWAEVTPTHGPKAWLLGPLPVGARPSPSQLQQLSELDLMLPPSPVCVRGQVYDWSEYEFSERWGVLDDPFLKHWASGPHGLKKQVPDEFIDLMAPEPGMSWYLLTTLVTDTAGPATLVAASRAAHAVWLDGRQVLAPSSELPPGQRSQWKLPHYDAPPRRIGLQMHKGSTPLLIELVQPREQRTRAYVAIDAPTAPERPALRWFAGEPRARFDHRPQAGRSVHWFRCAVPPGMCGMTTLTHGLVQAWFDGVEALPAAAQAVGAALETRWVPLAASPGAGQLELRVDAAPGARRGAALAGPVRFECGAGIAALGDWSTLGLADYSGAARYGVGFELTPADLRAPLALQLGEFVASAEVRLNGLHLAHVLTDDELTDLLPAARVGSNHLEVIVASALAQHFRAGSPSAYSDAGQQRAGLFGPVRILRS